MHDTPRRLLGAARDKSATQQLNVLLPFALPMLMQANIMEKSKTSV